MGQKGENGRCCKGKILAPPAIFARRCRYSLCSPLALPRKDLHPAQPSLQPPPLISITPSPAFIPNAASPRPHSAAASSSCIPARRGRWRGAQGTGALKIKRKMIKGGMWVSAGNPVTLETGSKYLG